MEYFGSKATSGLCQALIALMPPHSVYHSETPPGGRCADRSASQRRVRSIVHRPRCAGARGLCLMQLPGRVGAWLCPCLFGLVPVSWCSGAGLQTIPPRSARDPPKFGTALSLRLRGRVDHVALLDSAQGSALPGDGLRAIPRRSMTRCWRRWRSLALQVTTQAQVRDRGRVVQLRARPGALGELRRPELHRPRSVIKRKAANWGRRYKALPRAANA